MGIILKTYLSLNFCAISSMDVKKSITPFIIQEALDSPGCTLAVSMIAGLLAMSSATEAKLVIISMSTSLPASDLQRIVFLTLSLVFGTQVLTMYLHKSV